MKSIFHSTPRSRRAKPQPQHEAQAESPSAFFQPKLTINAPNDQYEREADFNSIQHPILPKTITN
ncbi:hypothetical protein [Haliscomenobacter sp.]|uniref:hypothetical protein n=1 Tax=Haliscomenobacter sp. TaxID=2717303 RepID=UPI003BA942E1